MGSANRKSGARRWLGVAVASVVLGAGGTAKADDDVPPPEPKNAVPGPSPRVEAGPAPAPYSVPWQLRALSAPTGVRIDQDFGFTEDDGGRHGFTSVTFVGGSARIPGTGPARAGLDLIGKIAMVGDSPPNGQGGTAFSNLLLGAAYAIPLPAHFMTNVYAAFTPPTGTGGGNDPDKGAVDARQRAIVVRSQLDNPPFSVNDVSVIGGLGVGWVADGWTMQIDGTVSHSVRVRGEQAQHEKLKTNLGVGAHVGYFFLPFASINTELRYQRFLNAPFAVEADPSGAAWDNLTFAVGPRFHVDTGSGYLRPGIAYIRGVDKPMTNPLNAHIVHVDLPFYF